MKKAGAQIAVALILAAAGLPSSGEASTNHLRMGVLWSPGSKGMADLQAAARTIARQTGGRVQVKFTEQRDLEGEGGSLDGAVLAGPYATKYSPTCRIFTLPLLFQAPGEVAQVRRGTDPLVAAELRARGLEPVALMDGGFAYLLSRAPADTVAQFKGARLWMPPAESDSLRAAESYGMTVVPLETAKVREGLRQGEVDTVIMSPLGAILLQWHTEVRYVMDAPFLCLFTAAVLREEALAKLEEPDRVVLRDVLSRAFVAAVEEARGKEAEALRVLVQNGVEIRKLGASPEQQAEWREWAKEVAERLVREGLLAAELLEQARAAVTEARRAP